MGLEPGSEHWSGHYLPSDLSLIPESFWHNRNLSVEWSEVHRAGGLEFTRLVHVWGVPPARLVGFLVGSHGRRPFLGGI